MMSRGSEASERLWEGSEACGQADGWSIVRSAAAAGVDCGWRRPSRCSDKHAAHALPGRWVRPWTAVQAGEACWELQQGADASWARGGRVSHQGEQPAGWGCLSALLQHPLLTRAVQGRVSQPRRDSEGSGGLCAACHTLLVLLRAPMAGSSVEQLSVDADEPRRPCSAHAAAGGQRQFDDPAANATLTPTCHGLHCSSLCQAKSDSSLACAATQACMPLFATAVGLPTCPMLFSCQGNSQTQVKPSCAGINRLDNHTAAAVLLEDRLARVSGCTGRTAAAVHSGKHRVRCACNSLP